MKSDLDFFSSISIVAVGVVLGLLSGCQKKVDSDGGNYQVRIPIDNGAGNYSLQTKELRTVSDLGSMAGTTAVIKSDGRFDIKIQSDGKAFITSSTYGHTPNAQFVKTGGVYYPADYDSLAMTAAMYHFESIRNFYDTFEANKGLTFPRLILINITEAFHQGSGNSSAVDNAAYVPGMDLFIINPYTKSEVPLSFNGGVLAHEYLHSIFAVKIDGVRKSLYKQGLITKEQFDSLAKLTATSNLDEWHSAQSLQTDTTPISTSNLPAERTQPSSGDGILSQNEFRAANDVIFSSINEGVADFFGYEYSGNPGWILPSLPTQGYRDLSQDKTFAFSLADQERMVERSVSGRDGAHIDEHGLGSFFSRFLFLVANGEMGHLQAKAMTLDFLTRYATLFARNRDRRFMSIGELVQLYFATSQAPSMTCQAVARLFSGELANNWNCAGRIQP